MSEELRELSRLLVRCRGWRWMPGMADLWGGRVREGDGIDRIQALPDLTDPATLGCLLALVRDAWGDPYLCCVGDRETGWRLDGYAAVEDIHSYSSEAEALFVALRAAP